MSIGTTICTILYSVYVGVKVLLEAVIPLTFLVMKKSIALLVKIFAMMNEVWKDITNMAVTIVAQLQKMIVDILMGLMGNPFKKLCENMWKCEALMWELLDGNSILCRLLFRAAEKLSGAEDGAFECTRNRYTKLINYISGVLSDFRSFMEVVCNFGFTVSFGVEELNEKFKEWQRMFNNWTKKVSGAVSKGIDIIEGLERAISATGIFDYLKSLSSFANCILETSDICEEFATINNQVSDVCSKFNLKQNPATGRYEFDKDFLYKITSTYNNAESFCDQMMGLCDGLVSPGGSVNEMFGGINYGKAYDLTSCIKSAYNHFTSDDYSFSKDIDTIKSKISDTWDSIWNSENLIVDNNLYAMGLYGIDTDGMSIGDKEIRYYMPYQYLKRLDSSLEVGYDIIDVTDKLHKKNPDLYPTKYSETSTFKVYYPDDTFVEEVSQSLTNDGVELVGPNDAYKHCYNYSDLVNLANNLEKKTDSTGNYVELKICEGGIMMFINSIMPIEGTFGNITNMDTTNYESGDKESMGVVQLTFNGNVDLNAFNKKVVVGENITTLGTLSVAMNDVLNGNTNSSVVQGLGEDSVKYALELGRRWYNFMNVNVGELASRYI